MSKSTGTSTCTNKCITVPVDKLVHNVKYIWLLADCPASLLISLPVISGPLTCNLGSSCSVLTCCVYAEPLSKHVTTVLNLDFCNDKMTVGIDRFSRDIRLSTYQSWGTSTFPISMYAKYTSTVTFLVKFLQIVLLI